VTAPALVEDAVQDTLTVLLPGVADAVTAVGAFRVPMLAEAVPLPVEAQYARATPPVSRTTMAPTSGNGFLHLETSASIRFTGERSPSSSG
jgi:hypothetical protein